MAQALYHQDHPLHEYLRDHGEARTIPGGLDDFPELNDHELNEDVTLAALMNSFLTAGHALFSPTLPPNREFAERFKYIVISSSLLSSSIATPGPSPAQEDSPPQNDAIEPPGTWKDSVIEKGPSLPPYSITWAIPLVALITAKSPSTTLLIAGFSWLLRAHYRPSEPIPVPHLTSTLDSLELLVRASNTWDSVVGKAMLALEEEDELQNVHPATEELRSALLAICDTMHSQADNIRHLFSPLTAPLELSMLSEMYAPATPSRSQSMRTGHKRDESGNLVPRRPLPLQSTDLAKRATWNGPNTRRTPIRALFSSEAGDSPLTMSSSTAVYSPPSPSVASFTTEVDSEPFASVALSIQRKRRKIIPIASAFRPSSAPSPQITGSRADVFSRLQSHRSPLTTPSSPSKGIHSEHPIRRVRSLSSLRSSLQSAVASRRYAASHLLALRFEEDAYDPYWEDVVSVINLLTSALEESTTSLSKACDEYFETRRADQVPTPPTLRPTVPSGAHRLSDVPSLLMRPSSQLASFAPMPTQLATFAAHMDAMSHAMECAADELRLCLAVLRSPPPSTDTDDEEGGRRANRSDALRDSVLESYGRLRRGLGAAIRECERGREPLLAALGADSRENDEENGEGFELRGDAPHTPPPETNGLRELGGDGLENSPTFSRSSVVFTPELESNENTQHVEVFDDVGSHLRDMANPFHLPPPNQPEQIFEAAVEDIPFFSRQRSKLSREERIQLAKERRATTGGKGVLPVSSEGDENVSVNGGYNEGWGPGGDVVQELKSVINLVGEKRRSAVRKSMPTLPPLGERPPPPKRPPPPPPPLLLPTSPSETTISTLTPSEATVSPSSPQTLPIIKPKPRIPPPIPPRPTKPKRGPPQPPSIRSEDAEAPTSSPSSLSS